MKIKYLLLLFVVLNVAACGTVAKLKVSTDKTNQYFEVMSSRSSNSSQDLDNEFQLFLQHYKNLYRGTKREEEYWTILEMKITEQNSPSMTENEVEKTYPCR